MQFLDAVFNVYYFINCYVLGIYGLYWLYCLADDVNTLTGEEDSSGFKVLILILLL